MEDIDMTFNQQICEFYQKNKVFTDEFYINILSDIIKGL